MAGPVNRSQGAFAQSASAATLTANLPTVDTNGSGAFLAICISKNNATHSCSTTGWSKVTQQNSGASFTVSLWKAAQGSAAPVFTWTGAAACSAQVLYYTDPQNVMDVAGIILLGAVGSGTTNPHTSAGGNTTRDNVLAVLIDASAINTGMAQPTGWTFDYNNGSATPNTRHSWLEKSITTSGTASGAVSVNGAVAAWVQFQVQLSGTQASGLEVSKVETDAWLDPADGLVVSKVETDAWLDPVDGLMVSKVEVNAWIEYGSIGALRGTSDVAGVGDVVPTGSSVTASGTGSLTAVGTAVTGGAGAGAGTATLGAVGAGIFSGVAAAAGVGTCAAVGAAFNGSAGAASGTGDVTATGEAIASSNLTASGTGDLTAISFATVAADGAAAGNGDVAAVGTAVTAATGSMGGVGALAGAISLTASGAGTLTGVGTLQGENGSFSRIIVNFRFAAFASITNASAGSSAGVGSAAAVGGSIAAARGTMAGQGSIAAGGTWIVAATGKAKKRRISADGASNDNGGIIAVGRAINSIAGTASGLGGLASFTDGSLLSAGQASGIGALTAVGRAFLQTSASFFGVGAINARGAPIVSAVGTMAGVGQLTAGSALRLASAGALDGHGLLQAFTDGTVLGVFTVPQGHGELDAIGSSIAAATGSCAASGDVLGVSEKIIEITGTLSGVGSVDARTDGLAHASGDIPWGVTVSFFSEVSNNAAFTAQAVGDLLAVGQVYATGAALARGFGVAIGACTSIAEAEGFCHGRGAANWQALQFVHTAPPERVDDVGEVRRYVTVKPMSRKVSVKPMDRHASVAIVPERYASVPSLDAAA